jgi:hypothetical protein
LQETGVIVVGDLIVEVNSKSLYHRPYQDTIEEIRSSDSCEFGFTRNI